MNGDSVNDALISAVKERERMQAAGMGMTTAFLPEQTKEHPHEPSIGPEDKVGAGIRTALIRRRDDGRLDLQIRWAFDFASAICNVGKGTPEGGDPTVDYPREDLVLSQIKGWAMDIAWAARKRVQADEQSKKEWLEGKTLQVSKRVQLGPYPKPRYLDLRQTEERKQ